MESSIFRFKLFDKEFVTKQNDRVVQPHTQKLQTESTKEFSVFLATIICPVYPALLLGLGVKLADS